MNESFTGSEYQAVKVGRNVSGIISNGSVSGDAHAPALVTSGNRSTGAVVSNVAHHGGRPFPSTSKVEPKIKHKCYAKLNSCVDNLERAIDLDEEFFLRNNALEQLKDTLSDLWGIRSSCEENFAMILNMLQGVFCKQNVEDFNIDQLKCLRDIFIKIRDDSDYDDNFTADITLALMSGGVDVFREIE